MSHTSSSSLKSNKRVAINIVTSTPVYDALSRRYTTSLSQIGTSSSNSEIGNRTKSKLQSQRANKIIKRGKNKKKLCIKRTIQFHDSKQETSTEWITESEESVKEVLEDLGKPILNESNDCINLFDDPCTPEKIRDAPMYESPIIHHSPILRSSRRFTVATKTKDHIIAQDKLLPVNIPATEVQSANVTDSESEIIFDHTKNVKVYKGAKEKSSLSLSSSLSSSSSSNSSSSSSLLSSSSSPSCLNIFWNAILPLNCSFTSDLLWKKFVEENREKMPQHIVASAAMRSPTREYKSEFLSKYPDIPHPKFESSPDSPNAICFRGHSTRDSREWVTHIEYPQKSRNKKEKIRRTKSVRKRGQRKKRTKITGPSRRRTVYDLEDETDIEFDRGGQDGKRLTLSEFRQKRNKTDSETLL